MLRIVDLGAKAIASMSFFTFEGEELWLLLDSLPLYIDIFRLYKLKDI